MNDFNALPNSLVLDGDTSKKNPKHAYLKFFESFKGSMDEVRGEEAQEDGYSFKSFWMAPLSSLNSAHKQKKKHCNTKNLQAWTPTDI